MGHDRRTGKITKEALKALQGDKKRAVGLKYLNLVDQCGGSIFEKACKGLTKSRKIWLLMREGQRGMALRRHLWRV